MNHDQILVTKRQLPPLRPEDDFRGLPGWYARQLGDEAFVIGAFVLFGGVTALAAGSFWWHRLWPLGIAGLLVTLLGVRALRFALRAWAAAEAGRRGR